MSAIAIVGVQWGDEGKGKVVDVLASHASLVVRFQGGNNAGHTLVVDGTPMVVHLLPSGVLHAGCVSAIGAGVVLDPEVLVREIDTLLSRGWDLGADRLVIDHRAGVILPHHRLIDRLREERLGDQRIGTTGRGIGPCYEDVTSRRAVRVADLLDRVAFAAALDALLPEREALIRWFGAEPPSRAEWVEQYLAWGERLRPFVGDVADVAHDHGGRGGLVLLEGAQGTLLDIGHGTWPYVTSSHTIAGAACTGVGIGPSFVRGVVGIVKAYTTRVGSGPFPTEDDGAEGAHLQRVGAEFGATTGRRRRCGWFDVPLVRQAVRLNGITSLTLTKLDVLTGLERVPVGVGRATDGSVVYEFFEGWQEPISDVRERSALPRACRDYVDALERLSGAPIDMISVGPDRTQTIGTEQLLERLGLR